MVPIAKAKKNVPKRIRETLPESRLAGCRFGTPLPRSIEFDRNAPFDDAPNGKREFSVLP